VRQGTCRLVDPEVPDARQSPLQDFNRESSLAGARAYDAFGVTNYTSGTALTPFEVKANLRLSGSQITLTAQGRPYYPEIGQNVDGGFRLAYFNGAGGAGGGCDGNCGPIFELHPAMPRKGPGGILPLPYPPERQRAGSECRSGSLVRGFHTASYEMPSIGTLEVPCNWVIVAVPSPCAGGGPPGESSDCNYDNLVASFPRENGDVTVTTAKGGPHSVNVCECVLRRKMCAKKPDDDATSCNYKLDCGEQGSFDIANTHMVELTEWMKKNCDGAVPCEETECYKGACANACGDTNWEVRAGERLLVPGSGASEACCGSIVSPLCSGS
jgi:hypothetical protein